MTTEKRAVDAAIEALRELSIALAGAHVDGVVFSGAGGNADGTKYHSTWIVGGMLVGIDRSADWSRITVGSKP